MAKGGGGRPSATSKDSLRREKPLKPLKAASMAAPLQSTAMRGRGRVHTRFRFSMSHRSLQALTDNYHIVKAPVSVLMETKLSRVGIRSTWHDRRCFQSFRSQPLQGFSCLLPCRSIRALQGVSTASGCRAGSFIGDARLNGLPCTATWRPCQGWTSPCCPMCSRTPGSGGVLC